MKKLICTILCGFLLLGSSTFVAKANDESNLISDTSSSDLSKYITYEDPMPSTVNKFNNNNEMENWKKNTEKYLENFYTQEIISVNEDSESIIFNFETDYMTPVEQVESVTYYKENSITRAVTGDTKVTSLVQWSNGAVPMKVDIKSASNFAAAASITIGLCKGVTSKMSALISSIASFVGWKIDSVLPVKAETRAAVKYKRNVGSYYLKTNVWWPNVQIGRAEYWYYQTAYQPKYKNGPWIPHHKDNVPNSAETNYNHSAVKPHYNDSAWIKNKSKQLGNSGKVYIDIFG